MAGAYENGHSENFKTDCRGWSARFSTKINPTAYNHTISILRHILEIAVEVGARYDNPCSLGRLPVRPKQLRLPESGDSTILLRVLKVREGDFPTLCRFGSLSCVWRIYKSEAANVTWEDVDFQRGEITVRGDKDTGTKNSEVRRVP